MSKIIAIHREPFRTDPFVYHMSAGETLEQMAHRVQSLPDGWPRHEHDAICINGHAVPRALWGVTRPKAGMVTEVTFHAPPMGGEGGGKQILGIVASIGLIALSGGVASGVFSTLAKSGVAVGKATLLGKLAGAAVLIGGSVILQALAPTPSVPRRGDSPGQRELGSASVQGNVLEPNASLPRVIGTRKIFPPFVTEPLSYFDGEDEVVEVLCALAGPHSLTDIRVGDAPVDEAQGVELETREGWPGLDPLTLLTRYGRTVSDGTPIRGHTVSDEDKQQLLTNTGDILDAIPQTKTIATRNGPDEFWMGIQFPQGLSRTGSQTELNDLMRVAFRIRIKARGESTWVNLPEIQFMAAILGPRRATIKFAWRDESVNVSVNVSAASSRGWVEARVVSPGQSIEPTTSSWVANSYFDANTGGAHYVTATNSGSSDVINVIMGENVAEFQLDRSIFPPGIYDVEIKRGYAFRNAEYSSSAYTISGSVRDTFFYEGDGAEQIHQTKNNLVDEVVLVRHNSVWNDPPVRKGDTALIALKVRNVSVDRLSVLASGYVRDWDGSAWVDWKTTSDPAPHLRDIFTGLLNATPLPTQIIDNQSLLDFRAAGWNCNAVIEGLSVSEAAKIVAGSGYAQFYQSEKFGVVRDRDRSADSPVQIFTPNNSANFSWSRGYPKLPDGFRATFVDADADYEVKQIIHPPGASRTEQTTIEGLVHESDVRDRLQYDLDTARLRSSFYSWDAASEAIKCRRGSLVGVASDVLSDRVFSGRVVDFDFNASGDVESVRIDNEPDLSTEASWASITNLSAVDNVSLIGATFGLAIRSKGEVVSTHAVTSSARGPEWVDLVTPAELAALAHNDVAAIGPLGKEYRRLIVVDMSPRSLTEWTIVAVSEAPELWL